MLIWPVTLAEYVWMQRISFESIGAVAKKFIGIACVGSQELSSILFVCGYGGIHVMCPVCFCRFGGYNIFGPH